MFHKELQIAYQHIGEHETSLLLFHAFPLNKNMYNRIDFTLLDGFSIITLDLPGFGDSPVQDGEFSMKEYAAIGRDLMNDLGYSKYFVGGTSMGGYISLAFEKHFSKHNRGFVLIDTKDTPDTETQRQNRYKAIEELKHGKKDEFIDSLLPQVLSRANYQNVMLRGFVRELMIEASTEGIIQALRAMAEREDLTKIIEQFKKPGILIYGEHDMLTPISLGKMVHERNENLHFTLIPNAGHLSPIEKPIIFSHVLSSFFRYIAMQN